MAMRAIALRLHFLKRASSCNGAVQSRASSGTSGRVLSEEERAAETMSIKKMEKERLEKLATEGGNPAESISSSSASESETPALPHSAVKDTSTDANKNVAVAAAVVALIASGWWVYRANKKVVVVEETD